MISVLAPLPGSGTSLPPPPLISSVLGHCPPSPYGFCHLLTSLIQTLLLTSASPFSLRCLLLLALGWKGGRSTEYNLPTHAAFRTPSCLSEALLLGLTAWLLLFHTFTLRESTHGRATRPSLCHPPAAWCWCPRSAGLPCRKGVLGTGPTSHSTVSSS